MNEAFGLKDYRATHYLFHFLRSQVQGWYTRENILARSGHPDGNAHKAAELGKWIETLNRWYEVVSPQNPPFLRADGSLNDAGGKTEGICRLLNRLFGEYAAMNDRLNAILDDSSPLHERRPDFQYIVACMGWVYYAVNHAVHGDIHFARKFGDRELLSSREGDPELSQKEVDFVNYLFHAFKDDTTYNPDTARRLAKMIGVVMDEFMKEAVTRIDRYLTLLGR
jgi:hypothetical protein